MLEIECDRIVDALNILDLEEFVQDTSIFGNNIHISVDQNFSDFTLIRKKLKNSSISIKRIDEIVPTLEDVFIHLLESRKNV